MKLNRTQLILSGILLMAALVLAVYFSRGPATPLAENPHQSIREILALPVNLRAAVEKTGTSLPATCPSLFARLTEGTVEEFIASSEEDKAALQSCSEAIPLLAKHDPQHISRLRSSCGMPDEEGSHAMQSNCALYYYFYKAGLAAFYSKDRAPSDLTTAELALVFFHEYNNLVPERLDALAGLADELLRRVPSFSVRKAKASIAFFQFMKSQKRSEGEQLLSTLASLKDQNPHDEQLLELHFVLLAVMNQTEAMNARTESFVKEHPSSAAGFYVRSAYYWQIKDREKTLEALKNAEALEPRNPRYAETRTRAEAAVPGAPGIYNVDVNFDLLSE